MKISLIYPITFTACFLFSFAAFSQLTEKFLDGNFTENPVWAGNTADWLVNAEGKLQSQNNITNSSFYLSTAQNMATTAQWEFFLELGFATSSTNYADVFLTASAADLSLTTTTGYFVRVGNTDDEISLYRKSTTGITKIIDGTNGILIGSNQTLKIKVTRNSTNVWTLLRDLSGSGTAFLAEGIATDATFMSSTHFGILIRQSVAGFFGKHYLDDIEVGTFVPDITPPTLVAANPISANQLEVLFSKSVDKATAETPTNYVVDRNLGSPVGAELDPNNHARVLLVFGSNFPLAATCSLTVNGVKDLAANALQNGRIHFMYYLPGRFDLVINEIMADPTPLVGLPDAEWIEIKNASLVPINIAGYRLAKSGSLSAALPDYILPADSSVAITSIANAAALQVHGRSLGIGSFPSLGNEGDLLSLEQPTGFIMHAVEYTSTWYQNAFKANGGFSLEMVDPKNPCSGASNWRASTNAKGGTPGRQNSVQASNPDQIKPNILRAFAPTPDSLLVFFNEPLDSTKASAKGAYNLSDGLGSPLKAIPKPPLFEQVMLVYGGGGLQVGKTYTITATSLTDCSGNTIETTQASAPVGLAEMADSLDIVINEILFNPKPLNEDFIEIINRGTKTINLQQVFLASRSSSTGNITSITALSSQPRLLFNGDILVATPFAENLKQAFNVPKPEAISQILLPSFPDDKGTAILLNQQGKILDELQYNDKWHFPLLNQTEGVALERIDPNGQTQKTDNWTSAAATVGYGTPTGSNSQTRASQQIKANIQVTPKVFSPDFDGIDDFALIEYQFTEPGYTANITLFNAAGGSVRLLQRNTTCSIRGSFRWDGLNDKQQKLPAGIYIALVEIFNLKSQRQTFKETVVLAKKFK